MPGPEPEPEPAGFAAGLAELGIALAPEDRAAALEGARRLARAARLLRELEEPGADE